MKLARLAAVWLCASLVSGAQEASISPDGKFVVFPDTHRAIHLEDPASGKNKILTQISGEAQFSWSADSKYLVVNNGTEAVAFDLQSSKVLWKSVLSNVQVSPDGRFCAFIRDNGLWITGLAQKREPARLVQAGSANLLVGVPDPVYAHEFHVDRHYWWSPDSSSIAYIETEFQQADHYVLPGSKLPVFRLKKVDIRSGKVKTVAESDDQWPYLMRVSWHPDSHRLVYYRLNRLQTQDELRLFDGEVSGTIFGEKDDYWINAPDPAVFVQDGKRLVVTSERTGARHAYLYELSGALVHDLTPPELEVYRLHPAVDPSGGVYVSGSKPPHLEQQLFRLSLSGGQATQITQAGGWHEVTLDASGGAYVDSHSSANTPPALSWHSLSATRQLSTPEVTTPQPVNNQVLMIKTHDGVSLPARLFTPEGFDPQKKYPVILYTFSGPNGRVAQDSWDGWQMEWNRSMVGKGFLILAVDVRGSAGYGHLFEEYIHYRFGAQETADLREVVSYLRRQSYVDGSRLGIWGCDYGAHNVVHAMLQFPGGFKAGFAESPITDWKHYDAYFTERYLGLPATRISEYDDSSALEDAQRMTGTLMVAYSPLDPFIHPDQVEALQDAMAEVKKNKDVIRRLHVLKLTSGESLSEIKQQMAEFFEQTL